MPAKTSASPATATPAVKAVPAEWIMPIAAVGLIFVMLVPFRACCSICCWR